MFCFPHSSRGFDALLDKIARRVCEAARKKGITFADVRLIESRSTSVLVQDGRADKVSAADARGAGVRVLVEGSWGFASCDGVGEREVLEKLEEAIHLARASKDYVRDPGVVARIAPVEATERTAFRKDPLAVPISEKVRRVSILEQAAKKKHGSLIVNSAVTYGDSSIHEIIGNTSGTLIERFTVRTSVGAMMTAASNGLRQRNRQRRANLAGFELLEDLAPEEISILAADRAVAALFAKKAPPGTMPVVFHPSITGLLVHEALGHNAEADSVWSGESILKGRLNEEIASPLVTIVDDSTAGDSYGSYLYDSEGTPGGKRFIIEKGVLKSFLHSLETASRFSVEPNGCARAQDYSSVPIVRMSNTYMLPGKSSLEELLSGIDRGVYLQDGHWGYVLVEKGQFTCHASVARMIEHGKLGEPLRDVTVSGLMLETLKEIEAVGSDFLLQMPGKCGKAGQAIPTDAGGPHIRIRKLVVGGAK